MSLTTFLYSLKVWLSVVFIAPILLFIGTCFNTGFGQIDIGKMAAAEWKDYQGFIIFGAVSSFPTWLIFLLAIMIAMKSADSARRRKYIVSTIAVLLAIGTFAAVFCFFGLPIDPGLSYFIISYGACIGAGSWFYKLEAEEKPALEILPTEQ